MAVPFGLGDPKKPVTFDEMLGVLRAQAKQFPDKRTGKNLTFSNIENFALSAFSVFHFQHPSFLASQQELEALQGKNNARTIFGIDKIPSDNHIRDVLDEANPELLNPVFEHIFNRLRGTGAMEVMRSSLNKQLLMAFDGLHFFESKKIDCELAAAKRWLDKHGGRYASDLPLKSGENALKVDWFELVTTTESGEIIYRNAFATDHLMVGLHCWCLWQSV